MRAERDIIDVDEVTAKRHKSGFAIASFVSSIIPLALILALYIHYLIVDGGREYHQGLWILGGALIIPPVAVVMYVLSVILGNIGLDSSKKAFAKAGMIVTFIQVMLIVIIFFL